MKFFLLTAVTLYSLQAFSAANSDANKSIKKLQAEVQELKKTSQTPAAKTGYVNLMEAFENTKQGRRVKNRLEKSAEQAKKQFKSLELKLQKEEEALKKEAPLLSEQARAQKIQQLQQKILNFQREAKNKDLELQNLQNQLMSPVIENIKKVIGEVAKKESYLVIENIGTEVLWVSPKLNLTQKVYKEFNKKYK